MFEFHGWAVICAPDPNDAPTEASAGGRDAAIAQVRMAMRDADDGRSLFDVRRTSNEMVVLFAHGLRNHRYEPAINLFRWLAEHLPDSYGLVYVHDDEDSSRDGDYENCFRVWRLARGRIEELGDPFLSPYIPTVEPPYEPEDADD